MKILEREKCRKRLEKVVKTVGEHVLSFSGTVEDIGDVMDHGHETSTLDEAAREIMLGALGREFPTGDMTLQFELHPWAVEAKERTSKSRSSQLHFIIDEIDGTTNTKRWAASCRNYNPHSAVCIAVCTSMSLESLEVGAVFTLDEKEVYSGIRSGRDFGRFSAYRNGKPPIAYPIKRGDTQNRLLVVGYTSKVRVRKAKIEEALWALGGCCIYDGCRSSTMDIVNIIRNQYDAYIDPRAVFGRESETRLETYDIAAILPSAYACDLEISDIYGEPLTEYNWEDPLPLLVARPEVYENIVAVLQNLSKNSDVIPTLEEWQCMLKRERRRKGQEKLVPIRINGRETGKRKQLKKLAEIPIISSESGKRKRQKKPGEVVVEKHSK